MAHFKVGCRCYVEVGSFVLVVGAGIFRVP